MKKIEKFEDLPDYGKYVLVCGIGSTYGQVGLHVCQMDDLEDGMDYRNDGSFFWLTESGEKIKSVTHWSELPEIDWN